MSNHRAPDPPTEGGRHRKSGRASWWATWWRVLTGHSPQRHPLVPAAHVLAQLARQHPARGVIRSYPRQTMEAS